MLDTKIGTTHPKLQESSRPSRKSIRQKRAHRKIGLMKKVSECSKMCGADVCLDIHIRDTGRVYMFSADASGFWGFLGSKINQEGGRRQFTLQCGNAPCPNHRPHTLCFLAVDGLDHSFEFDKECGRQRSIYLCLL
jgi:hypothetical protein